MVEENIWERLENLKNAMKKIDVVDSKP